VIASIPMIPIATITTANTIRHSSTVLPFSYY
jgi:hypothetical protein